MRKPITFLDFAKTIFTFPLLPFSIPIFLPSFYRFSKKNNHPQKWKKKKVFHRLNNTKKKREKRRKKPKTILFFFERWIFAVEVCTFCQFVLFRTSAKSLKNTVYFHFIIFIYFINYFINYYYFIYIIILY